jgi:hypothetical protein
LIASSGLVPAATITQEGTTKCGSFYPDYTVHVHFRDGAPPEASKQVALLYTLIRDIGSPVNMNKGTGCCI